MTEREKFVGVGAEVEQEEGRDGKRSSSTRKPSPAPPSPPNKRDPSRHWNRGQRRLDAAIAAAARARNEKRQAEAAQKAPELRALEITPRSSRILQRVFKLHMEELRAKQEEISKKKSEIKVLEAIIQTLSRKDSGGTGE